MLMEAVIASLLIGKARGGKFLKLSNNPINQWGFFILGILFQLLIVFFKANEFTFIDAFAAPMFLLSYVFILWGLVFNLKSWPMIIILIGVLLNFTVILLNGGAMPIALGELEVSKLVDSAQLVYSGQAVTYVAQGADTTLEVLGKNIAIKPPYPFPRVISIGDIVVSLGLMLYIQYTMNYVPKVSHSMLRMRVGAGRRY